MSVNIQFWSWINLPKDHKFHESHDWRKNWWNLWGSRVLYDIGCGHHCTDEDLHSQNSQTKLQNVSLFSYWAVFWLWFEPNQCSATVSSQSFSNDGCAQKQQTVQWLGILMMHFTVMMFLNKSMLTPVVMLLTCTKKVPCSNNGWVTKYTVFWFPSVPPCQHKFCNSLPITSIWICYSLITVHFMLWITLLD
jgi:hypothetical protein